jgi:hypothetical protein
MPVMAMLTYAGEVEAGERAVAPFRAFATPIVDMVKPMPDPEIYKLTEGAEVTEEAARSVFLDTVERSDLFCVPTDPADELAERADRTECTATLPGGEISAQGVSAFPEFSEIPVARNVEGITGGTRTYAGVRGE